MSQIHSQARPTPRTRAEIKASSATLDQLAERYNVSRATVLKWKHRDSSERSFAPLPRDAYDTVADAGGHCSGTASSTVFAAR